MKKDWMIRESELDDDQIMVLTATLDKSCIVSGCAGSGKSVLALIKAQRIQKEFGNNYKVIVFTKALRRYMDAGRQELGLSNKFTYLWAWNGEKDPENEQAHHSDYIIVDEIQDFTAEEIKAFIDAADKNFFFFGDTAQSIYEGLDGKPRPPVSKIRSFVPSGKRVKEFELYRNYRLPIPVAKVAHAVGVDLDDFVECTYKSRETAVPRFLKYSNRDEQLAAIDGIIKRGHMTDVAILLPCNNDVKEAYEKLKSWGGNYEVRYNIRCKHGKRGGCDECQESYSGSGHGYPKCYEEVDNLSFESTNPKIMTYHSAKGLQFETVFLPYVESYTENEPTKRKALYVAMTRTYRNLYVMYSSALPKILAAVDGRLYKTCEVDEIEDI